MAWILKSGKLPLQVLDIILLLFDEGHEALIDRGECGVVQHQFLQDFFFVFCGGSQVVEITFEGFDIATVFLELIAEGEMRLLAGG